MKLTRRSRVVTVFIALTSLLFMQFAVAAYACPALQPLHATHDASSAVMTMDASMQGCHGMDKVQPNLCHAHADTGNQSLDKPDIPQVQPFIASNLALTLHPVDVSGQQLAVISLATEITRATAPPLSIRNCCFRI
jgi:hypothetical protein